MTIKTFLGLAPNNRTNGTIGNWVFGWTSAQASALAANVNAKNAKLGRGQGDLQVGIYGALVSPRINER